MLDIKDFLRTGTIMSSQPGKVYAGWGNPAWSEVPDNGNKPVFYFPDYFLRDKKPWLLHENVLEMETAELLEILETDLSSSPPGFEWKNQDKALFEFAFHDLQEHFKKGSLKKGVPFIFETAHGVPSSENLRYFLKNAVRFMNDHPVFLYGFWDGENGMLGATPEMLFQMDRRSGKSHLRTVACAGTCSKDELEDFIKDPKQLHEHQLVVEGIEESLSPFGEVSCGNVEVLQLPHLCHLVTPIELSKSGELAVEEVVNALHPTPALGAFPKEEGRKWLRMYQTKIDRKRFGAPVGFILPDGRAASYVAIRNMQWFGGEIKIGAGCGIVPQSRLELEWKEILLKIKSIKHIMGI